jgi:hypothetical protein
MGQGEARLEGVAVGRNKITREILVKRLLAASGQKVKLGFYKLQANNSDAMHTAMLAEERKTKIQDGKNRLLERLAHTTPVKKKQALGILQGYSVAKGKQQERCDNKMRNFFNQ